MNKTTSIVLTLLSLCGSLLAGPKNPQHAIVDPIEKEPFSASVYSSAKLNSDNSSLYAGAGFALGYDLWNDVKISAGTTYFWQSEGAFDFDLSLTKSYKVWRSLSFYSVVGGGFEQNDENQWFLSSGGGLSWQINNFAVFTDATYNFAEDSDFKTFRLGLNYKF